MHTECMQTPVTPFLGDWLVPLNGNCVKQTGIWVFGFQICVSLDAWHNYGLADPVGFSFNRHSMRGNGKLFVLQGPWSWGVWYSWIFLAQHQLIALSNQGTCKGIFHSCCYDYKWVQKVSAGLKDVVQRVPFFKMVENRLKVQSNVLKRFVEELTEAMEQYYPVEDSWVDKVREVLKINFKEHSEKFNKWRPCKENNVPMIK